MFKDYYPLFQALIAITAQIVVIISGWFAIRAQIAKERSKMATKDYVDTEISKVNTGFQYIKKMQEDIKKSLEHITDRIDGLYDKN